MIQTILLTMTVLLNPSAFASEVKGRLPVKQVEMQWSLCEPAASALSKVTLQIPNYKSQNQYYFDSESLLLLGHGMQLRVRQSENDFTGVLKTNFSTLEQIPSQMLSDPKTECEGDKYSSVEKFGCKTKNKASELVGVVSPEQIQIVKKMIPHFQESQLQTWGPYQYEKWSVELSNGEELVIDSLKSHSGKKYLEISIRENIENAQEAFRYYSSLFFQAGIKICSEHINRTETVLKNQ